MNLFIDMVVDLTIQTIIGDVSGNTPFVPDPDISLVGSCLFDDDSVVLFEDGSQVIF